MLSKCQLKLLLVLVLQSNQKKNPISVFLLFGEVFRGQLWQKPVHMMQKRLRI